MNHEERIALAQAVTAYVKVWQVPGIQSLLERASKQQISLSEDERILTAYLLSVAASGFKDIDKVVDATLRIYARVNLASDPKSAVKSALDQIRAETLKNQVDPDKI